MAERGTAKWAGWRTGGALNRGEAPTGPAGFRRRSAGMTMAATAAGGSGGAVGLGAVGLEARVAWLDPPVVHRPAALRTGVQQDRTRRLRRTQR